jgi:hypothetical protein
VVAFPISVVDARVGAITVASHDYYAFGPEQMRTGLSAATRAADIPRLRILVPNRQPHRLDARCRVVPPEEVIPCRISFTALGAG